MVWLFLYLGSFSTAERQFGKSLLGPPCVMPQKGGCSHCLLGGKKHEGNLPIVELELQYDFEINMYLVHI